MNKIYFPLTILTVTATCFAAEPQNIPIAELGDKYRLIGKLHVPLGEVVTLQGVVVDGPFKGYEGGPNLRVQRIHGRVTQEDIQIVITPFFNDWGEESTVTGNTLPELEVGAAYEMEGYETGRFVGVPGEVLERDNMRISTTGHYFRESFAVIRASRIEPIIFNPRMFDGERALIQGKAQSEEGNAYMVGDGWKVAVLSDSGLAGTC